MFAKYKYHLFLLGTAFCYASIFIFSTFLTEQHIDPFTQIQGRAFFGALGTFLIVIFISKRSLMINKKDFLYLLLNSFLLVGSYAAVIVSIYIGTPIAKVDALIFTYPITVVFFAYLFLKDIPTIKQIAAIIISLISAMVLLEIWKIKNIVNIQTGELLALITSVYYAAFIILGKIIRIKTKLSSLIITFYSLFLLIPQLWLLGFILDKLFNIQILQPHLSLSLQWISWLILGAFGLISTTLPVTLFYIGMKEVKPNVASILLSTELAWVSVLGFILFGQILTIWQILGIVGITLAVLLV